MQLAAFDFGGTALKMGTVTHEGEILAKGKAIITDSDGEQILHHMMGWITSHPECEGVAISAPGYVNPYTGFIEMGGAIRRFDNFAIKAWLDERTQLPVAIENDANCVLRRRYSQYTGKPPDEVSGEEIFDAYDAGDVTCQRLVEDFFNGIGAGLYNLVNLFDPQTILLGGGITERPGFLAQLKQYLAWFGIAEYVDIVSHGNDAGLLGAVYHFNQQSER